MTTVRPFSNQLTPPFTLLLKIPFWPSFGRALSSRHGQRNRRTRRFRRCIGPPPAQRQKLKADRQAAKEEAGAAAKSLKLAEETVLAAEGRELAEITGTEDEQQAAVDYSCARS